MTDPGDVFSAVQAVSSSEEAYVAIRRAILDGRLRSGERIIEQRLAEALQVSRTPVREALHKLERENLVARSGRGVAVQTFSIDDVRVIYDMRAEIEGYAAGRAAERITDIELTEMRMAQQSLVAAVADPDPDAGDPVLGPARMNQHFHGLVVKAARSAPLERMVDNVSQTPLIYKAYLWFGEAEKHHSADGHAELMELLAARDAAGARTAWQRHIESGRDVLVQGLLAQQARDAAGV